METDDPEAFTEAKAVHDRLSDALRQASKHQTTRSGPTPSRGRSRWTRPRRGSWTTATTPTTEPAGELAGDSQGELCRQQPLRSPSEGLPGRVVCLGKLVGRSTLLMFRVRQAGKLGGGEFP